MRKKNLYLRNQRCDIRKQENKSTKSSSTKTTKVNLTKKTTTATLQAMKACTWDQDQPQTDTMEQSLAWGDEEMNETLPNIVSSD